MLKRIILTILCLILPLSVIADELKLAKNAPTSYVVKKGDTLWDISAKFLQQPWLWPKLWRINPDIENPHLIYPGEELNLVYDAQGRPMLVKGKPALKWSPKVRTSLKDQNPVETISLNVLSPFVKYDTVLSGEDIESGPYILGSDEGYKSSVDGVKLYVNGDLAVGKSYGVYQKSEAILSPSTEEIIGYHARLVGTGKAIRQGDKASKTPATIYVEGALREIRAGDIVKPVNEGQMLPSFFTMQAANNDVQGEIIKASNGMREFGKLEVVFIDQGNSHGVKQGDVLSVKRLSPGVVETNDGPVYTADASRWNRMANEAESDYQMPKEAIGKLMVFKVFDQVSMAIILNSEKPLRLQDWVTAP
ncbi:LysM peptidoglycan-binding domain-containing protein [Thalassotalea castellviae]|uniref:LysM domain-containing protein n=1 Tax=Thalassotalea castellviae TaxID=3075612 RepID=A0ABU3A5I0_9GAMM|nr:LysM domain-containing protein [Thalassotalea sp. W431]MDT0604246.1 LysM domain-containing protein [Thalassotalea sp. W431]